MLKRGRGLAGDDGRLGARQGRDPARRRPRREPARLPAPAGRARSAEGHDRGRSTRCGRSSSSWRAPTSSIRTRTDRLSTGSSGSVTSRRAKSVPHRAWSGGPRTRRCLCDAADRKVRRTPERRRKTGVEGRPRRGESGSIPEEDLNLEPDRNLAAPLEAYARGQRVGGSDHEDRAPRAGTSPPSRSAPSASSTATSAPARSTRCASASTARTASR